MSEHYEEVSVRNASEQIDVLREIRNEINTPELRDRIAIAALQGLLSASADEFWEAKLDGAVEQAYNWADAMLKVRGK